MNIGLLPTLRICVARWHLRINVKKSAGNNYFLLPPQNTMPPTYNPTLQRRPFGLIVVYVCRSTNVFQISQMVLPRSWLRPSYSRWKHGVAPIPVVSSSRIYSSINSQRQTFGNQNYSGEALEEQARFDLNAVGQLRPYIGTKSSDDFLV